jgi:hypothetical protein
VPLRLRVTRDGLRITGPAPGAPRPRPPGAQVLLRTENGDLLVTERGEQLILGNPDGQ